MEPKPDPIAIVPFKERHRAEVVHLWQSVFGYTTAHNEPGLAIDRKVDHDDGLFFVAETGTGEVLGTVMGGYDGHRGWIYSLAVFPEHRRKGIGSRLMDHVEKILLDRGCLKINLQVMEGNEAVVEFYERLGYTADARISLGKKLYLGPD
jgi:ribosomal protein S18 acetylase RimI-like enzyme